MKFTTLNTIVEDILKLVRGSIVNYTEPISRRQIEDWVHQYRAKLLKQDIDKGYYPNPDYIQQIHDVALVQDGNIWTSNITIPKPIDTRYKSGITRVDGISNNSVVEITGVPAHRAKWQEFKRYSSKEKVYYLEDNKLHLLQTESPYTYVNIYGIFENPMEVMRLNNSLANGDDSYPIPADKIPVIKDMIIKAELKLEVSTPADISNDSKHNPKQES